MSLRQRRGVALLIALLALLLIGALVSATLLRVQSDARHARDAMARTRAEAAAERMIRITLATTSSATLRALPVGTSTTSTDLTNGVTTVVTVVRTDSTLAWIDATASAPSVRGSARARLGASASIVSIGSASLRILPGDAWAQVY
jgi:Tfp pilus assembly protein PilV